MNKRNKLMKNYNSVLIRVIEDCNSANNPVTERVAIGNLFRLQKNILNSQLRRADKDILLESISDAMIAMTKSCTTYKSDRLDRLTNEITVPFK